MVRLILFIPLGIILSLFVSCSESGYRYNAELDRYLNNVHSQDIASLEDQIYYILDVENCSCSMLNIEALKGLNHTDNLRLIVVGASQIWEEQNTYFENIVVLRDEENNIYKYGTGFGKPIIAHYQKGKLHFASLIKDSEIEKYITYIQSNKYL